MHRLPHVSVVVCSYNGADVLADTLRTLQAQTYTGPFDIIVVNDGSADATEQVASSFKGIHVINNSVNKGLAGSRNVGIAAARGDIIAFTDDDCRPQPTWIQELAATYTSDTVWGVGGKVESTDNHTITLRYLHASKPLAPLEATLAVSHSLPYRFWLYLKSLLGLGKKSTLERKRSVYSLVGANMSFRASALKAVGGFDERFRFGAEEEDLCKRVYTQMPHSLIYNPKAQVGHQFEPDLRDTLRRSQAYGKGNARMMLKHADVNPIIYPFPLFVMLLPLLGLAHPILIVSPLIATPLIYSRWLHVALVRHSLEPILYAFIQCLQEWYGNIGFIKGWWQYRKLFAKKEQAA